MEDERDSSFNFSHKLRASLCLTCCFPAGRRESLDADEKPTRLIRASSSWLRSRAHELPEFKEKCRNLFCRIGKRRRNSADFRYDPLSYALNFDEGFDENRPDEFPSRNFSARLPVSQPQNGSVDVSTPPSMPAREIAALSRASV